MHNFGIFFLSLFFYPFFVTERENDLENKTENKVARQKQVYRNDILNNYNTQFNETNNIGQLYSVQYTYFWLDKCTAIQLFK